ncbi:MAG: methyltransferase [Flavobacteriales bacterium]|nr:methyltransferase [Flavobacteriales bacterium]
MLEPFKFKQFSVEQNLCAMKIGTDAVLLGAWSNPTKEPESILDIGTGTGLIALMMAQRFRESDIDAIEIDEPACQQAQENFERSWWTNRLSVSQVSFQDFVKSSTNQYDLIISNPPYFPDGQKSTDDQRNLARFTDALPFEELLLGVEKLLSKDGLFAVIIPYQEEEEFLKIANNNQLFTNRITHTKGTKNAAIKRSLIELSRQEPFGKLKVDELIIEISRHQYTEGYTELTKEFYLHM